MSSIDALREWRSPLTSATGALLLFETVTGLSIYLLPFGEFNQFSVLLHTLLGLAMILPVAWYLIRHWLVRRKGKLSHWQLLGYAAATTLALCTASGLVLTWQAAVGPRLDHVWDLVHLVSGLAMALLLIVHLATVIIRRVNNPEALWALRAARRAFWRRSTAGCLALLGLCWLWAAGHAQPLRHHSFPEDYNWRFGEDRPFAPSLARLEQTRWFEDLERSASRIAGDEQRRAFLAALHEPAATPTGPHERLRRCAQEIDLSPRERAELEALLARSAAAMRVEGAIDAGALAGSARCGTSGCHGRPRAIEGHWSSTSTVSVTPAKRARLTVVRGRAADEHRAEEGAVRQRETAWLRRPQ